MTLKSKEEIQNNEGHGGKPWTLAKISKTIIVVLACWMLYQVQQKL
jgi:ABC-type nickel/cobalt efflux system permease component RcnA